MSLSARPAFRIHLDAVGGVAGDMFVACMLDAFPDLTETVLADVRAVLPPQAGEPFVNIGASSGIRALRFGLRGAPSCHRHDHGAHGHQDHHHSTEPASIPSSAEGAPVSRFPALVSLLENARIPDGAKRHAIAILTILAEAEAHIHGVDIAQVHFHELADWDSLMDVAAAGSIVAALESSTWSVSPLPLGGGLVRTQHGLLPVPAPATGLILKDFVWRDDGEEGERVTPTGAAVLAHLVRTGRATQRDAGRLTAIGTGAGTRTLKTMPNILRALVFDAVHAAEAEEIDVVEFEVDDMSGEEIGIALDRLRAQEGVLDVSVGTRIGKKGRPLTDFRLLAAAGAGSQTAEACFLQTSTIGLRIRRETRTVLARAHLSTPQGRIKTVSRPDGNETRKVESDDLHRFETLAERRQAAWRQERGDGS